MIPPVTAQSGQKMDHSRESFCRKCRDGTLKVVQLTARAVQKGVRINYRLGYR
jgi:hypothetical protein